MISRVRENGFRRRDLSRFVASRRVRPPSPFRTPRSVPSRPLTLSLYIYFEQPRGGPVQGTRFESCRYTSCAQTLYSTFLVKAAINDAAPQCFRSLDPGSLDHGNRLDTNRSGNHHTFSLSFDRNCFKLQVTRTKTIFIFAIANISNRHFSCAGGRIFHRSSHTDESRAARSRYNRRTRLLIPG